LGLSNPSTGEFDWDKDWWDNSKKLDDHPGIAVYTTATLPATPWTGQVVYNTDLPGLIIWDGANWIDYFAGMFAYLQAGAGGVLAGRVVYIHTDGKIYHAGNTDVSQAHKVIGVVMKDTAAGSYGLVRRQGLVKKGSWGLTTGFVYYLSTDGDITSAIPASGFIMPVGVAEGTESFAVRISNPVFRDEADATLSGTPRVLSVLIDGTPYYFKAYPTKT